VGLWCYGRGNSVVGGEPPNAGGSRSLGGCRQSEVIGGLWVGRGIGDEDLDLEMVPKWCLSRYCGFVTDASGASSSVNRTPS
jgi:hypothetical protein